MTHKSNEKERGQVKALTGMGLSQDEIASVIGISAPTLRKHYRTELDIGAVEANAKVAQSLFRQATNPEKPNVVAAIFWLKARAGWRDSEPEGKKKRQEESAHEAGKGKFARGVAPRLAALNGKKVTGG